MTPISHSRGHRPVLTSIDTKGSMLSKSPSTSVKPYLDLFHVGIMNYGCLLTNTTICVLIRENLSRLLLSCMNIKGYPNC